jgi:pimeloyl-ACP methyl ester carboxylesterase
MTVTLSNISRSSSEADTGHAEAYTAGGSLGAMAARLLAAAAALGLLAATAVVASPARAGPSFAPCASAPDLECTQVLVPLDRSGAVGGTISLHVARLPATSSPRGIAFYLAGGPGVAGTTELAGQAGYFRSLLPGYTIVAVDARGTGASGVLRCPDLESATGAADWATLIGNCGTQIGPRRSFYSTRDHAEDIDDVRKALGLDRIALFGVSYGTKLALAYAHAHPGRVERMLLDSVLRTDLPDPLDTSFYRDLPGILRAYCADGLCRAATSNFGADFFALANRIAAAPPKVSVLRANGATQQVEILAEDLLFLLSDVDVDAGLAAELPAAVRAARLGYPRPLARLLDLRHQDPFYPARPELYSPALGLATLCADGPNPWPQDAAVDARPALLGAAVDAIPAGSFAPLGDWVKRMLRARPCSAWPAPTGEAPISEGPLPDVPVLTLGGDLDLRTPANDAVRVARLFPRGRALVVQGVGHGILGRDCPDRVVRDWLDGKAIPARCLRVPRTVVPLRPFPRAAGRSSPQATLGLARKALHDAEAVWIGFPEQRAIAGLAGGRLTSPANGESLTLSRYAIVPGVELSGTLRRLVDLPPPPLAFRGTVKVSGSAAARGTLAVVARRLEGALGGRRVKADLP